MVKNEKHIRYIGFRYLESCSYCVYTKCPINIIIKSGINVTNVNSQFLIEMFSKVIKFYVHEISSYNLIRVSEICTDPNIFFLFFFFFSRTRSDVD